MLVPTESGLVLLDEEFRPVSSYRFPSETRARRFLDIDSGSLTEEQFDWLKQKVSKDDRVFAYAQLVGPISRAGLNVQSLDEVQIRELSRRKIELMVSSSLAGSEQEAEDAVRDTSIELSDLKIKEKVSNPDLQVIQSVQALDEIDKTANIMTSRIREWYGLHFPELISMIEDNSSLLKLILRFKRRGNFDPEELEEMGYSKNKSNAIGTAARVSRGADLGEEDLSRILQLADEAEHLYSLRDKLATHVERTMRQVAPNLTEIAGATIGARVLAKAGGLAKLAVIPASTIQILGAEKALYRALRSGSRPPKHGILFQHPDVHSAPKWQRGKIARSVAGKIAIASRIDMFRGSRDDTVLKSLNARLSEIRKKYKEAPTPRPVFEERRRTSEEERRRGRPNRPFRRDGSRRRREKRRR